MNSSGRGTSPRDRVAARTPDEPPAAGAFLGQFSGPPDPPGRARRLIYRALVTRLLPWALMIVVGGVIAAAGQVIPGAALGGFAAFGAILRSLGFLREDVAAISPALVSDPGYEGKLGFLHLVDADMKRILDLANATPEHPLVVFVDDLDRCSYGTVAQVIEALNVFLAGDFESCIFVIGMEPDLVAAQIHVAYERLFDRLGKPRSGDLGWRFLEKMVQLPVALPPPSHRVDRYLDSILGRRPARGRRSRPRTSETRRRSGGGEALQRRGRLDRCGVRPASTGCGSAPRRPPR